MKERIYKTFRFCFFASLMAAPIASAGMEKIIGGQNEYISNFPHSAHLFIDNRRSCGASIIRVRILLTAAHCLQKPNVTISTVEARIGNEILNYSSQKIMAERWITPNNYLLQKPNYDLGLIYLRDNIVFGDNVKKAVLDFDQKPKPGLLCYVAGWGRTSPRLRLHPPFKSLQQIIQTHAQCKTVFKNMPVTRICTSSGYKGQKPYSGDSGSALVYQKHRQIGLVSGGIPNVQDLVFYTAIWPYKEWLQSGIKLLENSC